MSSYLSRLTQSKEARDKKQIELTVRQSQVQLMKEILDAEGKVARTSQQLDELKNSMSLNFCAIVETQITLNAQTEILETLLDLQLELFPENTFQSEPTVKKAVAKRTAKKA